MPRLTRSRHSGCSARCGWRGSRWLDVVDPSWLDRYGVHQERGNESIRHLLLLYGGHDVNHLHQIEKLFAEVDAACGSGPAAFEPRPVKPVIGDDPRADRLVKLVVDFGDRERIVIAGNVVDRSDPPYADVELLARVAAGPLREAAGFARAGPGDGSGSAIRRRSARRVY